MKDSYYQDPRIARAYDREVESTNRDIVTDDVPFYVGLAQEAAALGQAVLELGCGTGRMTLPIADAGVSVIGLDRSAAMLDVARGRSAGRDNPVWVEGDMADFELDQRFGLVIIPFRSFLLLLTVEEQKSCLRAIQRHLVPGGRLALNIFNPDPAIIAHWKAQPRRFTQQTLAGSSPKVERWETRRYDTASQQLDEQHIDDTLSDEGAVISRVYRDLRLRYVFRYEMEHLLALTGFAIDALYGWFDGRSFSDESSEMVWIARRPL